jgi:Protein phosphatase 2C
VILAGSERDRPWRFAWAAVEGTSHTASGAPCQDSAAAEVLDTSEGSVLVGVICDGAGSAAHADVGAWLGSRTLVELVELHFEGGGTLEGIDRDLASHWVERVVEALGADAAAHGRDLRDYACTLLAAVVGRDSAAFFEIGDGAIVISRGEDDWCYVFWPQHGEFANTTNFVVSPDARHLIEFAFAPERIKELALFSDGLENLVLHQATRAVHEPFFRQMLAPVRRVEAPGLAEKLSVDLASYLRSPRVCERTDDDKSLILASRWQAPG